MRVVVEAPLVDEDGGEDGAAPVLDEGEDEDENEGENAEVPVLEEGEDVEDALVFRLVPSLRTKQYCKVPGRKRRVTLFVFLLLVEPLVLLVQLMLLCPL